MTYWGKEPNRIYNYLPLGRRPKREYLSLIKVNISRINSKEEYSSSVRINISRKDRLGEWGRISVIG